VRLPTVVITEHQLHLLVDIHRKLKILVLLPGTTTNCMDVLPLLVFCLVFLVCASLIAKGGLVDDERHLDAAGGQHFINLFLQL